MRKIRDILRLRLSAGLSIREISRSNRPARSGELIGPEQRITVMEALKASTVEAAYQFSEEDRKGYIEAGKLADFVILSHNSLDVEPMALKDIAVVETIKEGRTIYRQPTPEP